jgi:predicted dehydrogenase
MYNPKMKKAGNNCDVISEDAATVNFRFEDGAIGTAVFSEISQGRINRLALEVTGEKCNLWWNSEDNNLLHTAQKGSGINTQIFAFGNGFTDTFRSLLKEYYTDVKVGVMSEKSDYPCFEEGAQIVRLCNALYESAHGDVKWIEV